MGYIEESIVGVLGGSKFLESKDSVIKDWSPNNYKKLIVHRDFIIAEKHLGSGGLAVTVKTLDRSEFIEDIKSMSNSSNGQFKINKLLGKRSLSCLEEIYVDPYMLVKGVLDLDSYVSELSKNHGRIRYYGVIQSDSDILNKVWNAIINLRDVSGSSMAENEKVVKEFGLSYKGVSNKEWFTKYYLRPRYYKLDTDGGKLETYFKKVESEVKKLEEKRRSIEKFNNVSDKVVALILQDDENSKYIEKLEVLTSTLLMTKRDICSKMVSDIVRDTIDQDRNSVGIGRMNSLIGKAKSSGTLKRWYENFNIIDVATGNDVDEKAINKLLERGRGFIDIEGTLDDICLKVAKTLTKNKFSDLVMAAYMVYGKEVPNGKFKEYVIGGNEGNPSEHSIFGYYKILGYVIGAKIIY